MIRLSASDLESYRYWKDNDESTLDELVRRLTHAEPPTREMDAGRALAKFFEHARPGDFDSATVDDWHINFDLDGVIDLPPVRELKGEQVYETPSGLVTLVGKVDSLAGFTVRDQKLSKSFDAERYFDSLQWRVYLDMFRARRFVYDVFVGKIDEVDDKVTITQYHPVTFYSYPGLHEDVQRAVEELADVVVRYVQPAAPALGARR